MNYTCKYCGKVYNLNEYKDSSDDYVCEECSYWEERIANKHKFILIDGKCYYCDLENPYIEKQSPYLDYGFGGRMFNIRWLTTDQILKTNNLWYNGVVPKWCKQYLPDNAEFVR